MNNFTHALLAAQEVAKEEIKSDVAYLTEENIVQVLIDIFMGKYVYEETFKSCVRNYGAAVGAIFTTESIRLKKRVLIT